MALLSVQKSASLQVSSSSALLIVPFSKAECHVESVIEVPAPAVCEPTDEQFWSSERPGYPDLDFLKRHLYREGRLSEEQAIYIITKATDIFKQEPNLLHVAAPITGTVHIHIYQDA